MFKKILLFDLFIFLVVVLSTFLISIPTALAGEECDYQCMIKGYEEAICSWGSCIWTWLNIGQQDCWYLQACCCNQAKECIPMGRSCSIGNKCCYSQCETVHNLGGSTPKCCKPEGWGCGKKGDVCCSGKCVNSICTTPTTSTTTTSSTSSTTTRPSTTTTSSTTTTTVPTSTSTTSSITTTSSTSPTTSTSTISSTTSTSTTSTTTTIPTTPPLLLECKQCYLGIVCECEVKNCDDGIWIITNKEGNPLLVPIVQGIPPLKVNYTPNATGKVSVLAICFTPEPPRVNSTIVDVTSGPITTTTTTQPTTTSTTTPPTTTSSTTTTTVPTPPLTFDCSSCEIGSKCQCTLTTSCDNGIWRIKNKEGTPLTSEVNSVIPPNITVIFYPKSTGKINATASCFSPKPDRSNSTEINVTEKFLTCPDECCKDVECKCTVKGCNLGWFIARQDSIAIKSISITSSPFDVSFIPIKVGNAEVIVTCDDPLKPSINTTIKVLISLTTTTITEAKFTGTDFKCSSTTCSLYYNNNYGSVYLVFFLIKPTGEVIDKKTNTIGLGQGPTSATFSCSGLSGDYYVSWKAFSDSKLSNPIAWSKSNEVQTIIC